MPQVNQYIYYQNKASKEILGQYSPTSLSYKSKENVRWCFKSYFQSKNIYGAPRITWHPEMQSLSLSVGSSAQSLPFNKPRSTHIYRMLLSNKSVLKTDLIDPALYCFCASVGNGHLWRGWEPLIRVQPSVLPSEPRHPLRHCHRAERKSLLFLGPLRRIHELSSILFIASSQRPNPL